MHTSRNMHATVYVWRSEDNFKELVLFFHYLVHRDEHRLSGLVKGLYLWSHLTKPLPVNFQAVT